MIGQLNQVAFLPGNFTLATVLRGSNSKFSASSLFYPHRALMHHKIKGQSVFPGPWSLHTAGSSECSHIVFRNNCLHNTIVPCAHL